MLPSGWSGKENLFSPSALLQKRQKFKHNLNEALLSAFSLLLTAEALFVRPCFSVLDAFCMSVFSLNSPADCAASLK